MINKNNIDRLNRDHARYSDYEIATVKRSCAVLSPMQPICTHTIGLHSKKKSHAYPVIRLPREFRKLVGAAATIYETTHNGGLAFLVVPHSRHKKSSERAPSEEQSLYTAGIKRSNRFEPIRFLELFWSIRASYGS